MSPRRSSSRILTLIVPFLLALLSSRLGNSNGQDMDLLPGQSLDAEGDPCWNNTRGIEFFEINNVTDISEVRTYILCPDTVFPIGTQNAEGVFVAGQVPLVLGTNQVVMCGKDGKSSNNCVFSGGTAHFAIFETGDGERVENTVVQGITFDSPFNLGAFLNWPGSIEIIDCVFQNHENQAAIYSQSGNQFFQNRRRRRLARNDFETAQQWLEYRNRFVAEDIAAARRNLLGMDVDMDMDMDMNTDADDGIRLLQDDNTTDTDMNMTDPPALLEVPANLTLFVDVINCTFKNLAHINATILTVFPLTEINVQSSTFEGIQTLDGIESPASLVSTEGSLSITDICVTDSVFSGSVFRFVQYGYDTFFNVSGVYIDDVPACPLSLPTDANDFAETCDTIDGIVDMCPLMMMEPPAEAPVMSPVSSPMASPMASPMTAPVASPVMMPMAQPTAPSSGAFPMRLAAAAAASICGVVVGFMM